MLEDLCRRKLRDIEDFEWQRFMRPHLKTYLRQKPQEAATSTTDVRPQPESNALHEEEEEEVKTVVLRCLDQEVEYGYEYLGCSSVPMFDARANNYIIAFTQVLRK